MLVDTYRGFVVRKLSLSGAVRQGPGDAKT